MDVKYALLLKMCTIMFGKNNFIGLPNSMPNFDDLCPKLR